MWNVLLFNFWLFTWCLEMEDFKIDTMGTYHGLTLKSVTEGVATKQQTHDHLVKQPGIPLYSQFPWLLLPWIVTNSTPVAKQQQVQSPVKESRVPIIIVPSVTSSVITVYNVVDFLQDYKYVIGPLVITVVKCLL